MPFEFWRALRVLDFERLWEIWAVNQAKLLARFSLTSSGYASQLGLDINIEYVAESGTAELRFW